MNNSISESDLAYMAGFFDGEGSVLLCGNHTKGHRNLQGRTASYHLQIEITSTDREIIDWFLETVDEGSVRERKILQPNHKPSWTWQMNGRKAASFLKEIYPFLKLKKGQAEIAFEFAETIGTTRRLTEGIVRLRQSLRDRITALNYRGVASETP